MGVFDTLRGYQESRRKAAGIHTPEETASAWQELNKQLNSQFEEQEMSAATDAAEANPGREINLSDHSVPPLERLRQQSQALLSNPNPVLQKAGMDALAKIQTREASRDPQKPTEVAGISYAKALGLMPGTPAFNSFIREYTAKNQPKPERVSGADADRLEWIDKNNKEPIYGKLLSEVEGKVRVRQDADDYSQTAVDIVHDLQDQLFNPETGIMTDGKYNSDGGLIAGGKRTVRGMYQNYAQNDERYKAYTGAVKGTLSPIIRAFGDRGALSEGDVNRALALMPSIGTTGWADSPDVALKKFEYVLRILKTKNPYTAKRILNDAEEEFDIDLSGRAAEQGFAESDWEDE